MNKLFPLLVLSAFLYSCHSKPNDTKVDPEFNRSSNIVIDSCTPETSDNLALLGEIWGFLKYHHPAVTAGKYNWDFELFRIMPAILDAPSKEQRNEIITNWVKSLGSFNKRSTPYTYPGETKLEPDLEWIKDKQVLGEELSVLLSDIKNAKRTGENSYVTLADHTQNPIFRENAYVSLPVIDTGYRLLSLFRYWNIIQYFFPNRHLIGENWHDVLKEFIPLFIRAEEYKEYQLTTLMLIAHIHDTHANLWSHPDLMVPENYVVPVQVRFIEHKAMVTDKQAFYTNVPLQTGDIILAINGEPVDSLISRWEPYYPASNRPTQLRDMAEDLLKSASEKMTIRYERNGFVKEDTVPCSPKHSAQIRHPYNYPETSYSVLPDNIGYVFCGLLKNDAIPEMMKNFENTKGLILDLRCYPRDFLVFTLTPYLLPEKKEFVKYTQGSISDPGHFRLTECNVIESKNKGNYYKGKVVILINEQSQSQSEYTAMAFRIAPHATVIGSTTAGADGDVSKIILPGNLTTMISGIGILTPEGNETQRIGIIPDLVVEPTIQGIRNNQDEILEKAIQIINSTNK